MSTRNPQKSKPDSKEDDMLIDIVGDDNDNNKMNAGDDGANGYSWEEEYKRSWDILEEDEDGSLKNSIANIQNQKRRRLIRDTETLQRGIIRHVYIVIDVSSNMADRDMHPTRISVVLKALEKFIHEFFDQNPISQLGIIVTKDGLADKLTNLSGNPMDHIKQLSDKKVKDLSGDPSIQNALDMAIDSLKHTPTHGSREVIAIFGSLTTCDPGDISKTTEQLKKNKIRVSMVHLAAEVFIFKQLCMQTKGHFSVALNEDHFGDIFLESIPPPPAVVDEKINSLQNSNMLVMMGFPKRLKDSVVPTHCVCHHNLTFNGYQCPQCKSKVCSLPNNCDVCALALVSSPHLARSYHHLFPCPNFEQIDDSKAPNNLVLAETCYGCLSPLSLPVQKEQPTKNKETSKGSKQTHMVQVMGPTYRYKCPKCQKQFCIECDIFIHENLHNCPGCCATANPQ
ncbi:hypothetical protein H4219_002123 [Mycoemilia scoparia]|uniref:General transcription and DNA repair factor IIH n=1 Tax=Mycoemilia scoparia TaxID=417184 RepID=A0A9W8DPH3_9FUNG|nr:hypothetical protein H4219_002123 [Mycoemilia scoparia]